MKKSILILGVWLLACGVRAMTDLNYNGLSDVWEFIYFNGPADPFADSDGDGVDNYDEMVWGTDPTNPNSKVTAPAATVTGSSLVFSWPAAPYRVYTLLGSVDLETWEVVTNGAIASCTIELDAKGTAPARFFRLSVSLNDQGTAADGLSNWEEALYLQTFGVLPGARSSAGDGMTDLQKFQLGLSPGQKDNPAVGLVVFTPLE